MHQTAGGGIHVDEAPEGAVVKTGGGDIDIRKASRFVRAETGGGNIDIEIASGTVTARTGAGDIDVRVEGGLGDGRDGIGLFTGYGEVTLILPGDASLELDLDLTYTRDSSRRYKITSDFEVDIRPTQNWNTEHGSAQKHIYGTGTINGGKHRVIVRNVNGNIRIKKR